MTEYLSNQDDKQPRFFIEDPTVMTIGTFDGLHTGHRKVISKICDRAKVVNKKSLLVTFRPHPLSVLSSKQAPRLLSTHEEKREMLDKCGLDYVAFLRFDNHLASYDPKKFVKDILVNQLGLSELVVGYDHRFGKARAGDAALLELLGREMEFSLEVMLPVQRNGRPISSSLIRNALATGDVKSANLDLGRPYALAGEVVTGKKRGRELGFPTANIRVAGAPNETKLIPCEGIYAVNVEVDSNWYMGALHIGPKPTFQESDKVLEVHLLDFDMDIYNKEIKVEFIEYIRGILSFEDVPDLISQMKRDIEKIRAVLEKRSTHLNPGV